MIIVIMTDLNELSQFEKDLKSLIDNRNSLKPRYDVCSKTTRPEDMLTFMLANEHGQPYDKTMRPQYKQMSINEHGQPYKPSLHATRMAVREHGQPYQKNA
jgi:hypothetical protein